MPTGRRSITTQVIEPTARSYVYTKVEEQIDQGRQVFWVCPLIEDSDKLIAKSVTEVYEDLKKSVFKRRRLGLLHGSMKADDKDAVMSAFQKHEINILVSTTVIEVGINVPNATVMVIESAERFGLAQIHQLRGRVGRSIHQSYCFLIPSPEQPVSKRLRVLENVSDGFRLSEIDLELRGPGAIYGTRQSGVLDLRIANLHDATLIKSAKRYAVEFVERGEKLVKYPYLRARVNHFRAIRKLN